MLTRVEINGSDLECANLGEIEIEYNQSSEDACFQIVKSIGQNLEFKGEAYDTIKTLTSDVCSVVTAVIYESCDGIESVFFNGFFTKTNCEFDDDLCLVSVSLEDNSLYNCFIKSWEDEINILRTPNPVTVPYQFFTNLDYLVDTNSNTPVGYGLIGVYSANSQDPDQDDFQVFIYARAIEVTACQAGEPQEPDNISTWTLVSNNCSINNTSSYARPATGSDAASISKSLTGNRVTFVASNTGQAAPPNPALNDPILIGFLFLTFFPGNPYSLTTGTYTFYLERSDLFPDLGLSVKNGRNLDEVIQFILDEQDCGLTFESEFFGTSGFENNPNPVTNLAESPTSGLLLFQKSDVADFDATESARIANVTLKTILSDLNVLFNVWWQIDETTGTLIFEHWSTLNDISASLDITQEPYNRTAKHNNSYTFSKASIPNKEEFRCAVESNDVDFTGLGITYDPSCAGTSSLKRQTQQICTDFEQVFNNLDFKTEGLMLIQPLSLTVGESKSQNGRITGVFKSNAPLGFGATLPDYYTFNRPLKEGVINNNTVVFDSTERLKNLKEITINFCCSFEDSNRLITTYQGPGLLQNGAYNPFKKTLTLNIITEL